MVRPEPHQPLDEADLGAERRGEASAGFAAVNFAHHVALGFVEQLPGPADVPVLAQHESLYLRDPARHRPRSGPALRVHGRAGRPADRGAARDRRRRQPDTAQPRMSSHFSPQRGIYGAGRDAPVDAAEVIAALPVPWSTPTTPAPRCSPRRAAHRPPNSSTRSSWPELAAQQAQQVLRRGAAATGPRVAGDRRAGKTPGNGSPSWSR